MLETLYILVERILYLLELYLLDIFHIVLYALYRFCGTIDMNIVKQYNDIKNKHSIYRRRFMYKSKRIIALLLSLMLIVLTFAACANKDEMRYTKAELEGMDAHELYELFLKNGLEVGTDIKEILSDKQLEEYIKEDFDLLIEGVCSRSDIAYKNLASEVEKVYKKLIKE